MVWQGILGNINMDNNSGNNLGGAMPENPAEEPKNEPVEEPEEELRDKWLELVDPENKVVVLGISFERAQGEDPKAFRKRWKTYLGNVYAAVDPGEDVPPGKRNNEIAMGLQMAKIGNALFGEARVPQSKKEKEQALKPYQAPPTPERKSLIFRWDQGVMTREEVSGEGERETPVLQTPLPISPLEQRVEELSSQVEVLTRSLQEQRSAAPLPDGSGAPDYAAMLEKLRGLEEQLKGISAGSPSAYPATQTPVAALDYKTLGDAIGEGVGGKIGAALKGSLEKIAELFAKIAATPRAPAQPATYIAQPLPSPQYEAPPGSSAADAAQPSPAASGAESGAGAPAPNYWVMDYKEVRRAAGTSLDAAEKMLLESAINNCSNPQGDQALQRLVSRKPGQAEAFRAYVQKHRERIGIAKPKAPR